MLRAGNWYKDLFFIYLQPSVNKNSQNVAILTLQFDDATVKTINQECTIVIGTISAQPLTSINCMQH